MADAEDTISPEEYARWLKPRAALDALKPMQFDPATAMLLDYARGGVIRTAALVIQFTSGAPDLPYQIISKKHWSEVRADDLSNSYFWDSGIIKEPSESTRFNREHGIERDDEPPEIVTLGVRFDPAGVAALTTPAPARAVSSAPAPIPSIRGAFSRPTDRELEEAAIEIGRRSRLMMLASGGSAGSLGNTNPKSSPRPDAPETERQISQQTKGPDSAPKPPLSDRHLQAWWTFYKAVTPSNEDTEPGARDHVKRCFPNHSVTRPRIRALRGKATSPGPKPKPAE